MIPLICSTAIERDFKRLEFSLLPSISFNAPSDKYLLYDITRNDFSTGYLLTNEKYMNDINLKLKTCLNKNEVCINEINSPEAWYNKYMLFITFGLAFALGATVGAAF